MAESYRADHVGSLLRPPAVLEARAAHAAGRISLAQLRDIEDKAILEGLEMQRRAGIDVFTDGECRRSWWSGAIAESVEGVIADPDAVFTPGWQGPHGAQADATAAEIGFAAQVVGAKLRQIRRAYRPRIGVLEAARSRAFQDHYPRCAEPGPGVVQAWLDRQVLPHSSGPGPGYRGHPAARGAGPDCRGGVLHSARFPALCDPIG